METQFAPAERLSQDEVRSQNKKLQLSGLIKAIAEATGTYFMILNRQRQIIYANKELLDLIQSTCEHPLGLRPGEVFGCVNSNKTEGGCGTHEFCRECGAVNAILEALEGKPSKKECRITSMHGDQLVAYDLSVKAYPFNFDNINNILVSILDISDKKRREILERTFFHDVLNSAAGLHGASFLMVRKYCPEGSEMFEKANTIYSSTNSLIEEIKTQQIIMAAENHELQLHGSMIELSNLLNEAVEPVKNNQGLTQCRIVTSYSTDTSFISDASLLRRVLINMIKNAVEESSPEDHVTVKAVVDKDKILFSVNNPKHMDESVKRQIFQRSFSTKGKCRGIGTYSMKLLGENYLKGKIWFESSESSGTTFYFELPVSFM